MYGLDRGVRDVETEWSTLTPGGRRPFVKPPQAVSHDRQVKHLLAIENHLQALPSIHVNAARQQGGIKTVVSKFGEHHGT